MHTNQNLDQTPAAAPQAQKIVGRGGRPRGSRAIIPAGHVGVEGLATALGVSPKTVPGMIDSRDPRIPPRSPIAGVRRIWRICDVEAMINRRDPRNPQADAALANSIWNWSAPAPDLPAPAAGNPRRRGRPRGTGKFSK